MSDTEQRLECKNCGCEEFTDHREDEFETYTRIRAACRHCGRTASLKIRKETPRHDLTDEI